jgi:general secretion pathway protein N
MSKRRIAALAAVVGALLPLIMGGSAAAQQVTANPLAVQSLEGLAATRDRPLFSAQRRPPAPPRFAAAPPPPPAPPPQPPQVAVYGIVAESNGARAMVRANGDKIIGVRVGDDIGGWKVTKIERREIELSLADRAVSFAMFSANAAAAATPAADEDDGQDGDPDNPDTTPRKRQSARD